jgi:hypothetical protein
LDIDFHFSELGFDKGWEWKILKPKELKECLKIRRELDIDILQEAIILDKTH